MVPEEGQATVTATVVVADALGNTTTLNTWSFTVNRKVPVVTAQPSLGANGAGWTNQVPTITLAATATVTEIKYALVEAGAGAPAQFSIYGSQIKFTVPQGEWDLWAFATDLETGLFGDPQLVASYKVNTSAPIAPADLQVTPVDTQWVKAGAIAFAFTGAEADLVATYSLAYEAKGQGGTFEAATPSAGQFLGLGTSYSTSLDVSAEAGEWRNLAVTVVLTDAADNSVSKLFNIGFGVDTVSPVVTSVNHSAQGPLKAGETLTITVVAESGLAATTQVSLLSNGESVLLGVTESVTTPGSYEATYLVQDGDNLVFSISASQTDLAGNQSNVVTATSTVKLDTTPPVLTSTDVLDAIPLQITGSVNHYKIGDLVKVRLMAEPGLVGSPAHLAKLAFAIPGITGAAEVGMTEVADGVYEGEYQVVAGDNTLGSGGTLAPVIIRVDATDAAGNTADLVGLQSIVIDTTAPVVTGKGHNAPAILSLGSSLQIGVSSEAGLKSAVYRFTTSRGDQSGLMVATSATPGFYQATYAVQSGDDVADGLITLELTDWAGNLTTTTIDRTITIVTVPPVVGAVSLIASRPGSAQVPAILRAGDTLQITFMGDVGLQASASVANLITNTPMTETNGTYTLDLPIQAGMNVVGASVEVTAVNAAGLSTTVTAGALLDVDTLPPNATATLSHNPVGLAGWYVIAPTITFAVEPGATLTVKNGDDVVDVGALTNSNGADTYTWVMPDGTYPNVTFQASDAAGNLSQLATLPVTKVDTTLPTAPTVTLAALSTPTTAVVEGTVQAGVERVALYVNSFFREYAVVTNGTFSFPGVRLDEDLQSGGSNSISLKAIDQAGNQSAFTTPISIVRDSTAPSFRIEVTPGEAGAGTVTVTASETLTTGLSTEDSSPVLTPTGVNGNVYSFSYTGLPGTTIRIRVSGTDLAGNLGHAHRIESQVDAQQGGTVSTDNGEVSATFGPGSLAGTGSVDIKIVPVLIQSITNNQISKGTQILGNPYDFQATLAVGQVASVSFKVNITGFLDHQVGFFYFPADDNAQPEFVVGTVTNRVTQGAITTATVTADLPHFSIWAPGGDNTPPDFIGGLTINGQVLATTNPTVKTSTLLITGTVDSSAMTVRAQIGGGTWVNGTLTPAGTDQTFSISFPIGTVEGNHTIAVEALDQVQNTSSQSFTVTIDTTAPALSATVNGAAPSGTLYTTGAQASINVASLGGLITVMQGATTLAQNAANNVGLTVPLVSNSTSTITITARDEAIGASAQDQGNVSAAQTITVRRDNAAPVIAVSGLSPTTTVTGSATLNIGYSITQTVSGSSTTEDLQSVTIALNGTQVFTGAALTQSGITLNFPTANTHTVTVTAVDRAGNTTVATRTVLYDPSAPAVLVSTPDTLTNQNSAAVTITHQVGSNPFPGAAIQITQGATIVNDTIALSGTYQYNATLTEGDNEILVNVTGTNTLTGNGAVTIRYDATPPTGTLQAPAATSSTGVMAFTADLTSEPAQIQIQRLATNIWTDIGTQTTLSAVGTHSVSLNLVGGAHQYRAKLTDEAGNIGYSTAVSVTYTVPETVPPAPVPAPAIEDPTIAASAGVDKTSAANVTITGSVTDAIEVEVTRGSTVLATVTVEDGKFSYIAPLNEGTNIFTLTVTNSAGVSATTTLEVVRDSTPPSLAIATGHRSDMVPTLTIMVSSEPDATVMVDGQAKGKTAADGHLTIRVDLQEGLNRFQIVAVDRLGNSSPVEVIQTTRTLPRQATLSLGYAPESTDQEFAWLTGWATPGSTYTITQNAVVVKQGIVGSVGRFVTTVDLAPGLNAISVEVAIDETKASGSLTIDRITVKLNDLGGHWADQAITELVAAGVISGFNDGSFRPEGTVTRAEFAKMIVTALALPVAPASDLKATDAQQIPDWAKGYVAAAMKAGLISGFEDGSFRPDQKISRIQIVVIMSRALMLKGITTAGPSQQFVDQASIPSWAASALTQVSQAGLVAGFEDGTFRPSTNATRAQAAALTLRLMKVR